MYDQPSTRRFGPGLIAFLVALAIAAGFVGYFGARSVLAANNGSPDAGGRNGAGDGPTSSHGPGPTAHVMRGSWTWRVIVAEPGDKNRQVYPVQVAKA